MQHLVGQLRFQYVGQQALRVFKVGLLAFRREELIGDRALTFG